MASGRVTNFGANVRAFEEEAGAYLDVEAVTVSSGTMGLLFALQALDLQPARARIVVPSFTFMATIQAILYAGATPVFAEIGDDLTMSLADLDRLLEEHNDVRAVLPVHMYGLPCRVGEIDTLVRSWSVRRGREIDVLYDAAHAFGSSRGAYRVGGGGRAEIFSLSVTKVLVSVEGGIVATRDAALAERIRKMRNYGIESSYNAHYPGLNGKMSELHAIIGLYNLRRLDSLMAKRQCKARYYLDAIHARTVFDSPPWPADVVHTFKDLTVLIPSDHIESRDAVMASLAARGIETRAYFCPPAHRQEYFRRFADRPLPKTEEMTRRVITLPFYTSITTEEMDYVVDGLREAQELWA
jgi:dTDP-4-amino-4,6-dideoxygalactose transaminase